MLEMTLEHTGKATVREETKKSYPLLRSNLVLVSYAELFERTYWLKGKASFSGLCHPGKEEILTLANRRYWSAVKDRH